MKRSTICLKGFSFYYIIVILLIGSSNVWSQGEDTTPTKDARPVSNTFESIWLIDNQTVMVPFEGTLEWDMQHRFGEVKNGFEDLFGIFGPSTIRLGLNYVPIDRLQIGFGITSFRLHWDFNAKYALLKQARSGGWPVSVSYLANVAIDTRDKEFHLEFIDRLSYFHQIMIARKFSDALSLQVSGNVSHLNYPRRQVTEELELTEVMKTCHISVSLIGKLQITEGLGFIFNYDQPITNHDIEALEPESNLSFGIETVTSSHAFQVFFGNYRSIIPQLNNATNTNRIGDGEFAIGFNITRLWNF